MLDIILAVLASDVFWGLFASAVLALAGWLWKDKRSRRMEVVEWAVRSAYYAVEDLKRIRPHGVTDKVAEALRLFHRALEARGVEATPADDATAKLAWSAIHGAEKVAAAGAAAAVAHLSPR